MTRRPATRLDGANRFKLGLFAPNCSGGLAITKAPERWDASWENNVALARMAEAAGLEFLLPIARWHGYRGEIDAEGSSFETLGWATGLLAATKEISVFATVHVPFINPVFAAKQVVTADHVGRGRFVLNVVSGGNLGEFEMFGIELLEHDERYAYSEEWLAVAKRVWSEEEPFDFEGKYFRLKGVLGKPKPYGGGRPPLMSAGSSPAGRAFAARHADCLFMNIPDIEMLARDLASLRAMAAPRAVGVYASGHVICRPTPKEARDYHRYVVDEMGDWEALSHIVGLRQQQQSIPPERLLQMKERLIGGIGTYPIVGSPDEVAALFKRVSDAGLDGMAVGFVNYLAELPYFRDEVLPRMQRLGLRAASRVET